MKLPLQYESQFTVPLLRDFTLKLTPLMTTLLPVIPPLAMIWPVVVSVPAMVELPVTVSVPIVIDGAVIAPEERLPVVVIVPEALIAPEVMAPEVMVPVVLMLLLPTVPTYCSSQVFSCVKLAFTCAATAGLFGLKVTNCAQAEDGTARPARINAAPSTAPARHRRRPGLCSRAPARAENQSSPFGLDLSRLEPMTVGDRFHSGGASKDIEDVAEVGRHGAQTSPECPVSPL